MEKEEGERKAEEDRRIRLKYQEGLRQQLEYTQGRKKQQQLMSDYERRLNRNMIESYMLSEGGDAIPDAYTYSKNRVPSRNLRDRPELQKELLIKDLDYFKRLISPGESKRPQAGSAAAQYMNHSQIDPLHPYIEPAEVPADQTRRRYKSINGVHMGEMRTVDAPSRGRESFSPQSLSPLLPKLGTSEDPLEFAHPVVDHKFYKNRILSKRSHVF